jgi:hypothetical protein
MIFRPDFFVSLGFLLRLCADVGFAVVAEAAVCEELGSPESRLVWMSALLT